MELNLMFCLHLVENSVTDKLVRFISGSVIYSIMQEEEEKRSLILIEKP